MHPLLVGAIVAVVWLAGAAACGAEPTAPAQPAAGPPATAAAAPAEAPSLVPAAAEALPAVEAPALPGADPLGSPGFDLGLGSDEPLEINSQELEATQRNGERLLVFSRQVVVEQGDMRIESDRLEAFYPQGDSQPERLVATGSVQLVQGKRRARCDEATYRRSDALLVCAGNAEVEEDGNRLRGRLIEFDLEREVVKVKGGASVLVQPESPARPEVSP